MKSDEKPQKENYLSGCKAEVTVWEKAWEVATRYITLFLEDRRLVYRKLSVFA